MAARTLDEIKRDALLFSICKDVDDIQLKLKTNSRELLLYSLHPKYYQFKIHKPGGGSREIETPALPLKEIQKKLNYYLQAFYYLHQPVSSYGYIIQKHC